MKNLNFFLTLVFRYSVIVTWLFLTGCSFFFSQEEGGSTTGSANFIVDQVEGTVTATRVNGLPEEVEISYKACFRDFIHPDNTLQNHLFNIHLFEKKELAKELKEPSEQENKPLQQGSKDFERVLSQSAKEKQAETSSRKGCSTNSYFLFADSKESCISMRTDSQGCLHWTEVYPYHSVSRSAWFRYERAFEGVGGNKGTEFIPMAVNPWLSLDPSGSAVRIQLVDLRYYSIDEQKRTVVSLKDQEIPQCRFCTSNKNKEDCDLCEQRKRSLSQVMSHFEQTVPRPRLWVSSLDSSINQERFFISEAEDPEHLKVLKQFKVCHAGLNQNCDPPGRFFKVRLRLPLQIQVKNYRGEEELLSLTRGQYSVKAYLFLKDEKKGNVVLHRDMDFISARLSKVSRETVLISEFYLHVPYEHYGLPAFLGLKVQPEGNLSSFLPFEGVFSFPNRLKSVIGRNALSLNQSTLSFYEKQPNGADSLIEGHQLMGAWQNLSTEGFRKAGWDVKLNRFRFSDISIEDRECPTPVDRVVRYVGEVCLIDPLTGEVVPNTGISIQRQSIFFDRSGTSREGEVVNIPSAEKESSRKLMKEWSKAKREYLKGQKESDYISDTSGCLQWVDKIHHKWYNREKYIVRKMIFSKKEWGFEGERMIAVNPWHWGFVFFQDVTRLGHSSIRTSAERAERSQIVLHDFRNVFADPIYTIDRWLGINLFQTLLMLFRVRVDNPNNVSVGLGGQRPSAMDVRRGYYFLRFILVKSHTEEGGGKGNQVINDEKFRTQYNNLQPWNTNTGWKVGRDGSIAGQMMSTNLEYITHFDTYVQIRDSVVNAYINFLFDLDEFIFIGSNNRLIVQLLPTDPQYYKYDPDTCKVDPTRSDFVPFTDHELITRPFMGTFVPGDQRNWNIYRVLSEDIDMELPQKNGMQLNMDAWQLEQFVKKGKETSIEHKLFSKIQSHFTVQVRKWGDTSMLTVRNIRSILESVNTDIQKLLSNNTSEESYLSHFNQNKDHLVETLDKAINFVSTTLEGSLPGKEQTFLKELNILLNKMLLLADQSELSNAQIKWKLKETWGKLTPLAEQILSEPLLVNQPKELIKTEKNPSEKWFKPDISFPKEKSRWADFNMRLFAKDEGLRVISLEENSLIDQFLKDLNSSAEIHNSYHFKYNNKMPSKKETTGTASLADKTTESSPASEEEMTASATQNGQQTTYDHSVNKSKDFWNNFELFDRDDYTTVKKKIKQLYLPEFSHSWLKTVLMSGIHQGTLETPEVMTFLHSLCGFWFDKFYDEYLKQEQLDIIFLKHMEHYDYYAGVLDYISHTKGAGEQYRNLFEAMQQYSLKPMDQSFLKVENPFRVTKESSERFFGTLFGEKTDTESESTEILGGIYQDLQKTLTETLLIQGLLAQGTTKVGGVSYDIFNVFLQENRHPYFKCLNNPLNFFHIEEKIIVGDIGSDYSDLKYEYGYTKSVNLQRAFDDSYAASWSTSRSFSTALGTGFTFLEGLDTLNIGRFINPLRAVAPFASFNGLRLSADWSAARSDSDASRRQQSVRFSDTALYLQVNHSVISIRLEKFKKCVVVRSKNTAFDGYKKGSVWKTQLEKNLVHQIPYIKSGLLLCSEDINARDKTNPFYINEDYFYMYQLIPGDRGQFQNPLNFRNRPFVMSVRGRTEMDKLFFLMHSFSEADKEVGVEDYDPLSKMTNPYNRMSYPAQGAIRTVDRAQVWDKTGFYPGVYNVKYDEEHYYFTPPNRKEQSMLDQFGDFIHQSNPLSQPTLDGFNEEHFYEQGKR